MINIQKLCKGITNIGQNIINKANPTQAKIQNQLAPEAVEKYLDATSHTQRAMVAREQAITETIKNTVNNLSKRYDTCAEKARNANDTRALGALFDTANTREKDILKPFLNRCLHYSLSTEKGIEKADSFWTPAIQKEYSSLKTEQDFNKVVKKLEDLNTYNNYKKAVTVEFLEGHGGNFEDCMERFSTKGVQYKN